MSYGTTRNKLNVSEYTSYPWYLLTHLEEFTEYFVHVRAEFDASISSDYSSMQQTKTLEDCELMFQITLDLLIFYGIVCYDGIIAKAFCEKSKLFKPRPITTSTCHANIDFLLLLHFK